VLSGLQRCTVGRAGRGGAGPHLGAVVGVFGVNQACWVHLHLVQLHQPRPQRAAQPQPVPRRPRAVGGGEGGRVGVVPAQQLPGGGEAAAGKDQAVGHQGDLLRGGCCCCHGFAVRRLLRAECGEGVGDGQAAVSRVGDRGDLQSVLNWSWGEWVVVGWRERPLPALPPTKQSLNPADPPVRA
jgi:hypothetical protein